MRKLAALLPAVLLATTAMAQDVTYNYAKEANFSAYKTCKWVEIGGQKLDELTENQLKSAIQADLATKGLMFVESDDADLLLGLQFATREERSLTAYNTGWGYGGGWYGAGGTTTAQTSTILIGSVVLDMYDRAAKKLVWRGTATKTLDVKAKPDKRQKNINKAMNKLLKNYPPPIKK
jgi:hypothetical protein